MSPGFDAAAKTVREMPHSLEAEQYLIGAAMIDAKDAIRRADEAKLSDHSFFDSRHGVIFSVVREMTNDNEAVEPGTVLLELTKRRLIDGVGREYFHLVSGLVPTSATTQKFVDAVRDCAIRRRRLRANDEAREQLFDEARSVHEVIAEIERATEELAAGEQRSGEANPFKPRKFSQLNRKTPDVLVHGILHKGCKMVLGGASKSNKTWALIDLGISVANGIGWWGVATQKGRVLYLNLEVIEPFFAQRLDLVAKAKGATLDDNLVVVNLRGHTGDAAQTLRRIEREVRDQSFDMIVIDPIYKLMAGRDENAAGEIGVVMAEVDRLATRTGAAAVFGAHFSKGNQSGKESMDRIGGSGVFARDPDAILTLTAHEEEQAYTLDATLRNCPKLDPFVLRWEFPLMRADSELDPAKIKKKTGRNEEISANEALAALGDQLLTSSQWRKATKMTDGTFRRKRDRLVWSKKVEEVGNCYRRKAV